ncbi:peptidoglycan D,D-transpeptidase FtsI family protein [Cytobacillus kochii]|uniref:serine-type D-Ala-D-Ala carboxypeptidase n=1 Tax=Cytobacillus kochii TaxID=859143 RepID=A0A248TMV0_9BACI|nr:penicillin-binding protein 2 [Cytobacillus kochii]ASV69482.1 penicillin-binding protein [Cytobacillus kochii]
MAGEQKRKKRNKKMVFRINLMFFAVFILFSILIFRLGIVQIVYGENYKKEIEREVEVPVASTAPRGQIYDSKGRLVVGNKPQLAISYTRSQSTTQEEMIQTSELLAKMIKKDTEEDLKAITERDKQDFWIIKYPNEAAEKVSDKEKDELQASDMSAKEVDDEIYKRTRERITEEELNAFKKDELEVLAIFREMASSRMLTPHFIKNKNVNEDEFALVSENLHLLPGIDTTVDWERYNALKDEDGEVTLSSVLGNVSSSKEGLPSEMLEYYQSKGYSRNDRVGKSYLELQYESVLQGQKKIMKNYTDKTGEVTKQDVVREGQAGKDLVLTTDIEFQQEVEKIIEKHVRSLRGSNYYLDRGFVSAMNPQTGEVLAMAGKQFVKDEKTGETEVMDYALGNMTSQYSMGSTIKGATVLAGYEEGVISPWSVLVDRPLYFDGTQPKRSWNTAGFGAINDLTALRKSSNVYMFLIAMRIGGQQEYIPRGKLRIDKDEGIRKLRYNFHQFGLGVKTGIDLPGEVTGQSPIPPNGGNTLDFAIGQFDTYSPLQLAQYVSTIANGGYRMQPQIVKEIREPNLENNQLGAVYKSIEPNVLNKITMKDAWIEHVQDGFIQVVNHPQGTANSGITNKKYKIAGKTGTAQAYYGGPLKVQSNPDTWNLTFVGYAPYDNPEIAISVVIPWLSSDKSKINLHIADEVFDAYFKMKTKQKDEENEEL